MKTHKEIYLGAQKLATSFDEVNGTEVKIDGETYYKIIFRDYWVKDIVFSISFR